jgi:chemotaxis protein MotB
MSNGFWSGPIFRFLVVFQFLHFLKENSMKRSMYAVFALSVFISSCVSKTKLEAANQQIANLNSRVDSLIKLNQDCQQSVSQLKTENASYSSEAEECRKAREAYKVRVDAFNQTLKENGSSMEQIRAKIAASLETFKDAGIATKYKNGLVYISMQDKLMFPSGSVKLNDLGRQALSVIADALAEYKHLVVYVVGNTDSVMVVKGYKDNWSLSTERANTIVRVLRDQYGADPYRIVSAGRGKYDPMADNATEQGRALNRRIDIVLNPDLSRLWGIMVKENDK